MNKFKYKDIEIEYNLLEQPRKTLAIIVKPTQDVVIKVPLSIDQDKIDKFIKKKAVWISKQQNYFSQFIYKNFQNEYVSGESFLYLGKKYKLLVKKSIDNDYVSLNKGVLQAYSQDLKDSNKIKKLLDDWYEYKRIKIFNECLKNSLNFFDYDTEFTIKIRKLNKRWGSYISKSKTIILNPQLIQASKIYIQYVIIHELCHYKYKEHNSKFYELLYSKLPNWKQLKSELEIQMLGI